MSDIIEEDLGLKLEEIEFDKDPYHIIGELMEALQKFDTITGRKTLHVIRPKLE
jgi:hypothetical protein